MGKYSRSPMVPNRYTLQGAKTPITRKKKDVLREILEVFGKFWKIFREANGGDK